MIYQSKKKSMTTVEPVKDKLENKVNDNTLKINQMIKKNMLPQLISYVRFEENVLVDEFKELYEKYKLLVSCML